ncbi:MAG: 30S ribosomal protein S4 [Elusimicrobiota bacterium]
MGRYLGPSCRKCRALKQKLFLKGEKCQTKCILDSRKGQPGQHTKATKKITEYAKRMYEKQKARFYSGLTEEQFRRYFARAQHLPGLTGTNLLMLLEMRLDNVVRIMGLASSMKFARQIIRQGHVLLNDRVFKIPAYKVKVGDKIYLDEKMRKNLSIVRWREHFLNPPSWVSVDRENFGGSILSIPTREEISCPVDETLIVELYSK